jgi:hypothetical protein
MRTRAVTSRCLAAILSVDVVGYSRLMGEDKAGRGAQLSQPQEWHAYVQVFALLDSNGPYSGKPRPYERRIFALSSRK